MASSSTGSAGNSGLGKALYEKCLQAPTGQLFNQHDLLDMGIVPGGNPTILMQCVQALMDEGLAKVLIQSDGSAVWRMVKQEDANKYKILSPDEALIYSHIESCGREGIWTKNLKNKVNIHQSVLNRCIKSLEGRNYIKAIKNVKYPTRKIYMLASLTPSEDITGGPWFTDSELDNEFISALLDAIEQFVTSKSFYRNTAAIEKPRRGKLSQAEIQEVLRNEFETPRLSHTKIKGTLLPFPPGYKGYPTAQHVAKWVGLAGITDVSLGENDIRQLLEVLCYDGRVEKVLGGMAYKAVRRPVGDDGIGSGNGLTEAPCGRCPVFNLCEEGGPVSASGCEYFNAWLEI
ncbi:MAG: 34-kDa subunit of RNA polymerase III (C) [Geoglossum simile]|nr:MAG: 34-kDa subunit of RNA polymerase III (C) [Geoglossum simile]